MRSNYCGSLEVEAMQPIVQVLQGLHQTLGIILSAQQPRCHPLVSVFRREHLMKVGYLMVFWYREKLKDVIGSGSEFGFELLS
jgi:hypothetical protein